MKQKLDYMHDNPVRDKYLSDRAIRAGNLAATAADYEHSSARLYICNKHAAYPVMNFLELDDIDLTKTVTD